MPPGEKKLRFAFLRKRHFRFANSVIARVTLDMAMGKEFDYLIPAELADAVEVGSRVKVPFASRQVLACVTAVLEASPHAHLARDPQGHRAPIPCLAKDFGPGALDERVLLLPAGNHASRPYCPRRCVKKKKAGANSSLCGRFRRRSPCPN